MTKGVGGYGRYDDDPNWVGCPRAKTSETPCIARDGRTALGDNFRCVGCTYTAVAALTELRNAGVDIGTPNSDRKKLADQLRDIVRRVTEPAETEATNG